MKKTFLKDAIYSMESPRDCFVLVISHGRVDTINPEYIPMPSGSKITTILLANTGIDCFVDMLTTKIAIVGAMSPAFFHASPPELSIVS